MTTTGTNLPGCCYVETVVRARERWLRNQRSPEPTVRSTQHVTHRQQSSKALFTCWVLCANVLFGRAAAPLRETAPGAA